MLNLSLAKLQSNVTYDNNNVHIRIPHDSVHLTELVVRDMSVRVNTIIIDEFPESLINLSINEGNALIIDGLTFPKRIISLCIENFDILIFKNCNLMKNIKFLKLSKIYRIDLLPELLINLKLKKFTLDGGYTIIPRLFEFLIPMSHTLQVLKISNNSLQLLPDILDQFTMLISLDISHNPIDILPEKLFTLKKLKKLDCSNCKLTSIPANIQQLTNLRELNLHYNNLTDLPSEFRNLRFLNILTIYGNNIKKIPECVKYLKVSVLNIICSLDINLKLIHDLHELEKWINIKNNMQFEIYINILTRLYSLDYVFINMPIKSYYLFLLILIKYYRRDYSKVLHYFSLLFNPIPCSHIHNFEIKIKQSKYFGVKTFDDFRNAFRTILLQNPYLIKECRKIELILDGNTKRKIDKILDVFADILDL